MGSHDRQDGASFRLLLPTSSSCDANGQDQQQHMPWLQLQGLADRVRRYCTILNVASQASIILKKQIAIKPLLSTAAVWHCLVVLALTAL